MTEQQIWAALGLATGGLLSFGGILIYLGARLVPASDCSKNHEWRARGLQGQQLDALVRSQGRLHCGPCEKHPFVPFEGDPIRCGTCEGVLI